MADAVEALSEREQAWLAQLEQHALLHLRSYLGDNLRLERSEADLGRVQSMIDDGVFESGDSADLAAFGVVLGNVFDAQTSMKWAVVTNEFGRMVAVHDPAIGFTLYPIQMISKRLRDGRAVNVPDLYRSFVRDLGIGK